MNYARLAVAMLLAYSNAGSAFAGEPGNAIRCRVSDQSPSQKLVSFDAGPWQEYSKKLPESFDWVEIAEVKRGQEILVSIDSGATGEISIQHELCYDAKGNLLQSQYEVWTAWGWGYSESANQRRFFELESGKTIPTPTNGVDVAKHDTYKEFRDLPFAKLIAAKNQQPTTKN